MHQVFCVLSISPRVVVSAALAAAITTAVGAQAPAPKGETFQLTVDSIMRGPDLVGYPPEGLRWSADSAKLYFEWRKPGQDEASLMWLVGMAAHRRVDGGSEEGRSSGQRAMG